MSARRLQRRSRGRAGMTLLEVLVASAVFAMMSVMLFTAFTHTGRLRDRLSSRQERDLQGRVALLKLTRDLRGAFVSAHVNGQNLAPNVTLTAFVGKDMGNGDSLEMTAFTHRRLRRGSHEGDACEVGYRVVERRGAQNTTYDLLRRETARIDQYPQRGGTLDVLATNVSSFEIKYYEDQTSQWLDSWDTTSGSGQPGRLPSRVRATLVLKEENGREQRFMTETPVMMQQMLRFGLGLDWR